MDTLIEFVAQVLIVIPIIAAIYLFFVFNGLKRKEYLYLLVASGILALVLAKIGSHIHPDPRPYITDHVTPLFTPGNDSNGFPSDHTLLSSLIGFVVLHYHKRAGISLLILAALIGWARVAANVHHAWDIVGSFIITAVSYLIISSLLRQKAVRSTLKLN